jgi:hypothetical protein
MSAVKTNGKRSNEVLFKQNKKAQQRQRNAAEKSKSVFVDPLRKHLFFSNTHHDNVY